MVCSKILGPSKVGLVEISTSSSASRWKRVQRTALKGVTSPLDIPWVKPTGSGVAVGVGVSVGVGVGVGVSVGAGVSLGVGVGVLDGVAVGTGADVGVGVGSAPAHAPAASIPTSKTATGRSVNFMAPY